MVRRIWCFLGQHSFKEKVVEKPCTNYFICSICYKVRDIA